MTAIEGHALRFLYDVCLLTLSTRRCTECNKWHIVDT